MLNDLAIIENGKSVAVEISYHLQPFLAVLYAAYGQLDVKDCKHKAVLVTAVLSCKWIGNITCSPVKKQIEAGKSGRKFPDGVSNTFLNENI